MKNKINQWNILTNDITEDWIRDVFEIDKEEEIYFDWVSDSPGSVFNFADYWVSFDQVLDYYKHNITKEQFFEWYSFCMDNQKVNISLAKFILSPKERKEQQKKQLKELEYRVKFAEEEFKKALKEFI